jgi:GAF domain-containing protein
VVFKGLIAATAAVALAATPALAAGTAARLAPAPERIFGLAQGEDDDDGSGIIIAVLAGLAVLGGIWAAVGGDDDEAVSPT